MMMLSMDDSFVIPSGQAYEDIFLGDGIDWTKLLICNSKEQSFDRSTGTYMTTYYHELEYKGQVMWQIAYQSDSLIHGGVSKCSLGTRMRIKHTVETRSERRFLGRRRRIKKVNHYDIEEIICASALLYRQEEAERRNAQTTVAGNNPVVQNAAGPTSQSSVSSVGSFKADLEDPDENYAKGERSLEPMESFHSQRDDQPTLQDEIDSILGRQEAEDAPSVHSRASSSRRSRHSQQSKHSYPSMPSSIRQRYGDEELVAVHYNEESSSSQRHPALRAAPSGGDYSTRSRASSHKSRTKQPVIAPSNSHHSMIPPPRNNSLRHEEALAMKEEDARELVLRSVASGDYSTAARSHVSSSSSARQSKQQYTPGLVSKGSMASSCKKESNTVITKSTAASSHTSSYPSDESHTSWRIHKAPSAVASESRRAMRSLGGTSSSRDVKSLPSRFPNKGERHNVLIQDPSLMDSCDSSQDTDLPSLADEISLEGYAE